MTHTLPTADFFGFYRRCLNGATDRISVPAENVAVGVCADHRDSQRLILSQQFKGTVVIAANDWPWKDDRCAAVAFIHVGPSRLDNDTLSCPNGHTGPFQIGVHGSAEFYELSGVHDRTISVGGLARGPDTSVDGTAFLSCPRCGRAFSAPHDITISWW